MVTISLSNLPAVNELRSVPHVNDVEHVAGPRKAPPGYGTTRSPYARDRAISRRGSHLHAALSAAIARFIDMLSRLVLKRRIPGAGQQVADLVAVC
jgi:hypothetical protein